MRDLGNLGVKVLHYEFQYSPHLCFVHPAEPLDEVVDSRALQAPLTRPGTLSTAGHLLQSIIRSPPLHMFNLSPLVKNRQIQIGRDFPKSRLSVPAMENA